ncbi:MAG: MBOAT family protein [Lachnospiraceae bacterium]|nr:MBOAT family protein [Lachnospiraceae bacterium]
MRPFVLLAASLAYIAYLSPRACIWVCGLSLAVYAGALSIQRRRDEGNTDAAKRLKYVLIALLVLLLAVMKFVSSGIFFHGPPEEGEGGILRHLLLPLGLSYYLFQAVGYLTDVERGTVTAEKNPVHFLLYMTFFPKFVSGPIERAETFLSGVKQLSTVRLTDPHRCSLALSYLLYGYFMKTVLADRMSLYASRLLLEPHRYGYLLLLAGMLFYTLQIYCDFAGYSAIALGISHLFGLSLTENFHAPYLSTNITVFWRRWHRSLSMWLRDYLYIPLGGSRKGLQRKRINTMIVFLVCGLWHGTGWHFVIWGLLHGLYSVIHSAWQEKFGKKEAVTLWKKLPLIALTFFCVAFAWIFFGSPDAGTAFVYIRRMLTLQAGDTALGVIMTDRVLLVVLLPLALFFDMLCLKKDKPVGEAMQQLPYVPRYVIYYLLIVVIYLFGVYGPGYDAGSFMYMEF